MSGASTTVTLLRHENGAPSQFLGIIEDITDRKQADALRSRLAAVIEYSDDAIITKTLEGIITTWNPGAQRIFGYTADEVIGKPVTMLIPEITWTKSLPFSSACGAASASITIRTVRRRKDGALIDVRSRLADQGPGGAIIGASKIARDITRRNVPTRRSRASTKRRNVESRIGSVRNRPCAKRTRAKITSSPRWLTSFATPSRRSARPR